MPYKIVSFHGKNGGRISLADINGLYLPITGSEEYLTRHLERLSGQLQARDNDVVICAYPKSGLHWIWEVVNMLQKRTSRPSDDIMENYSFEFSSVKQLSSEPSPRVFVTHLTFDKLPQSFRERRCKIVYICRDPRSVAVSFFHYVCQMKVKGTTDRTVFSGEWPDFLQLFTEGKVPFNSWLHHTKAWDKVIKDWPNYPIHVVNFEDTKQDPLKEILKLNTFLGSGISSAMCTDIATNTKIRRLRAAKAAIRDNTMGQYFQDNKYPMYRKGVTDDWKNLFTVAQNEDIIQGEIGRLRTSNIKLTSLL
ncbi:sulfotransferase family cytosolic 1B member 1-like [Mizuhopecten yessoensis]|uniref:Estrogen sulfotransferase n=1 Tax=Mizuhopecten yessoensis TaxID=6573 RepID=A0A210QHA0_MIZYE|nr:sulfotransferase family cytosolic 1B member 1-like [Mizuhopecten yessoensis]XP_021358195.1 sulfotransferase family cytosolic 1B member 1-like [Mizuhopecten yessoensis]OWF48097.1 Estrogen sulfotransferase [Mizuhopecten yessoensis]